MELLAKFRDAAGMLWLNLDERERRVLLLALVYLAATAVFALEGRRRERQRSELRETILEVIADARRS